MNIHDPVQDLLASAGRLAEYREARGAWVRQTAAAWRAAQRRMDERCDEALDRLDEEAFERLCDAEQAKVDAFLVPLTDAARRDLWPRHLHWGGI